MTSEWKGSVDTARSIAQQIGNRWGEEEVKKYDPLTNCFTYNGWKERGFQVKKGEKGMRSVTFVEGTKKDKTGKESNFSYPRSITLFYEKQVEKIIPKEESNGITKPNIISSTNEQESLR
jgi:hypothetical protein